MPRCWGVLASCHHHNVTLDQLLQTPPPRRLEAFGCACVDASTHVPEDAFHASMHAAFADRLPRDLRKEVVTGRLLPADADGRRHGNGEAISRIGVATLTGWGTSYNLLFAGVIEHLLRSEAQWPLQDHADPPEWLEFGVASGFSTNLTCEALRLGGLQHARLHGFDVFTGLPTRWQKLVPGRFSTHGIVPPVHACAELHRGLINETLGPWLAAHPRESTRLVGVSIDVDLYDGALQALRGIGSASLLRPRTLVHFHEIVQQFGPADNRLHGRNNLMGRARRPHGSFGFFMELANRQRAMEHAHSNAADPFYVLDEQRALFDFLRASPGAEWYLLPYSDLFDPSMALFAVLS